MRFSTLSVFFAWFRHLRHTPPCQGRARAILTWCAKRLLPSAQRALVLALTGRVGSPQPEPGRLTGALLRLRACLAGRATPVAVPAPPQSSPVVAWFRRA